VSPLGRNIQGAFDVLVYGVGSCPASASSLCHAKKESLLKHVHPELTLTTVLCSSCGNAFTTRSTRSEISVDVCSNCHPAYTGIERAKTHGDRIERFERRRNLAGRPTDQRSKN
jgi:large subunit ribosomal protein L31